MQQAREELPTKIDIPDAVVQQQTSFGDTSEYGEMAAEYFRITGGTDITPLLEGLPDDMCQVPHWGYVLDGALNVRYTDDTEENNTAGEFVYWPPGHTVRADEDAEFILFSPNEHEAVFDHMLEKMNE